jgi:asparagine synthase (glutamine-hydrolysing)
MCGFAGFWARSSVAMDLRAVARGMADTLVHRGPDDGDVWADESAGVALGHRRLSILDLSPAGHQPMTSACGRYTIAYNGEIYNHLEIRRALETEGAGPSWRGHSDTEVILAAFVRWGVRATLERSVGMFALALWDRQERTLFLARDRLGEKPLYYGQVGEDFVFASELKALKAYPFFKQSINRDALCLLMRHNYIAAPHTIYEGIRKVLPGSILTLHAGSSEPRLEQYWSVERSMRDALSSERNDSEAEAVEQLDALLRQAIAGQMVADVSLGAFLSGGIDSSTVVALMQAQSARPVRTYSIGFFESGYNEAEHAKRVASHLGTTHTELYLTPEDALSVVPRLPELYDEPFADSSQIPTFLLSQMTRRHVTVALSGDGGDELFYGYGRYLFVGGVWRSISHVPVPLRRIAACGLRSLKPATWNRLLGPGMKLAARRGSRPINAGDKLHKLARVLASPTGIAFYRDAISYWEDPSAVVVDGREPVTALSSEMQWPDGCNLMQQMSYLDMVTYLPDNILVKVDRAAMGVSLETRIPLLDHRVVEFANRMPLAMKVHGSIGKQLLRRVLYRYVPKELVERPKMGFGVPIDAWLRGPLREWAEALIGERRLSVEGYFEASAIRRKWKEHLAGHRNWHYHLWGVLMFQAWLDRWSKA